MWHSETEREKVYLGISGLESRRGPRRYPNMYETNSLNDTRVGGGREIQFIGEITFHFPTPSRRTSIPFRRGP
jgi:hypothetical protein